MPEAGQAPQERPGQKQPLQEATQESDREGRGKLTDDLWIELLAQRYFVREKHAAAARTDPAGAAEKVAREWEALLRAAGITQEDWEAWTDRLAEDPDRYTKLVRRASELVKKLRLQSEE